MADAWLEDLSIDECWALIRGEALGRIAFSTDERITVFPVNFRVVDAHGTTPGTWLALRTRPGNVLDRAAMVVAFEIDGVDVAGRQGWSVLIRGTLHHVDPDAASFRERFDSDPWLAVDREAWLIVEPFEITGRRLHPDGREWPFSPRGYA